MELIVDKIVQIIVLITCVINIQVPAYMVVQSDIYYHIAVKVRLFC